MRKEIEGRLTPAFFLCHRDYRVFLAQPVRYLAYRNRIHLVFIGGV